MSNRNKCFIKVAMCVSLLLFLVSGCKNQSKDLANKDVQTQQDMSSNAGFIDTNEKDDIQNNIISGEKKAKDGDSKISNTIEGDKTEKEISKEKKSIFSNFIGKKRKLLIRILLIIEKSRQKGFGRILMVIQQQMITKIMIRNQEMSLYQIQ